MSEILSQVKEKELPEFEFLRPKLINDEAIPLTQQITKKENLIMFSTQKHSRCPVILLEKP